MRILVTGDRHWHDREAIQNAFQAVVERYGRDGHTVIHGGAPGADTLAGEEAQLLGWEVVIYPAQWDKYGRAAGPVRNQEMLTDGKPELVLAFHNDLSQSKGTADMVRRAKKAGFVSVALHKRRPHEPTLLDGSESHDGSDPAAICEDCGQPIVGDVDIHGDEGQARLTWRHAEPAEIIHDRLVR